MSEIDQWLKRHAADSGQKIADSSAFVGLVTKNFLDNPACALQIGFAVLMDKPIVLIVDEKETVSKHLTKIATRIERVDMTNQTGMIRAQKAIQETLEALR